MSRTTISRKTSRQPSRQPSQPSRQATASLAWVNSIISLPSSRGTKTGDTGKKPLRLLKVEKCSPRVIAQPTPSIELHDFQMAHWQKTFDTMGGLSRLQSTESVQTEFPDAVPFHCSAIGRQFQFHYGHVKPMGLPPPQEEATNKPIQCKRIQRFNLPIVDRLSMDKRSMPALKSSQAKYMELQRYLPKSTVRVRWRKKRGASDFSSDDICELMNKFGLVVFTILESQTCMLTTFESIQSAYSAVSDSSLPSGVLVTWADVRFHNYGHYISHQNYTVSTDKVWVNYVYSESKQRCIQKLRDSMTKTKSPKTKEIMWFEDS